MREVEEFRALMAAEAAEAQPPSAVMQRRGRQPNELLTPSSSDGDDTPAPVLTDAELQAALGALPPAPPAAPAPPSPPSPPPPLPGEGPRGDAQRVSPIRAAAARGR